MSSRGIRNNNPGNIRGLAEGEHLSEGETRLVELRLGPGSMPPGQQNVQSSFFVDSNAGVLMNVAAQTADRS